MCSAAAVAAVNWRTACGAWRRFVPFQGVVVTGSQGQDCGLYTRGSCKWPPERQQTEVPPLAVIKAILNVRRCKGSAKGLQGSCTWWQFILRGPCGLKQQGSAICELSGTLLA